MSVYPNQIDSDTTIFSIDNNFSEIAGESINQLKDAVIGIEQTIGINPQGSKDSLTERINVSISPDGKIKYEALSMAGLVTLPIVDSHIADNAGIKESKLFLAHSTTDLYTLITQNINSISNLQELSAKLLVDFQAHLSGSQYLSDSDTSARHVASHIDLNAIPNDPRDLSFNWTGLKDKYGIARTATNVAEALFQINQNLIDHQNTTSNAHPASAITIDTDPLVEIPPEIDNVQKFVEYQDQVEQLNTGLHRATQHAAGIPKIARSLELNGQNLTDYYRDNIVPPCPVKTYLVHPPATNPVDNVTTGDDIITFVPNNSNYNFDAKFSKVKPGDIITVAYDSNLSSFFTIDSIRYTPGIEWTVRINGINLKDTETASARIDRSLFDTNTAGILAVAAANATPYTYYSSLLGGLIVGDPRGATAIGLEFHSHQIDSEHYNLYLELYPSGNPEDHIISLPSIDITGNLGSKPGSYTLSEIVQNTNNSFRQTGYNYRFIAFEYQGNFCIMLSDSLNGASFAILNGSNSTGILTDGNLTNNVIGDALGDGYDALGFGKNHANLASPKYQSTFLDATAAQIPTIIVRPFKRRDYIVNGKRRDTFKSTFLADDNGYWSAEIYNKTITATTIEVTYKIDLDLCAADLKPGKSLIVQPTVEFNNTTYDDIDYGRFIIKSVSFIAACGDIGAYTLITVINGVHSTGNPISSGTASIGTNVKIHFSCDSIGFNNEHVIDGFPAIYDFHRFHEIYINDQGKTFAHERLRMPIQSETSELLNTNYFHITDVSFKLQGYSDDSISHRKYLRLYILSYNDESGEFDGYLGQRDPLSSDIFNVGPISIGRKNVPVKFYDQSNINYIEILFQEFGTLSTIILGSNIARYVDLEIFPTLSLQDDLLLLATCEVSWDKQSSQNIVDFIKNQRQFGSIDPLDFTQSAVDFIRANDQNIHENGIYQGFEYLSYQNNKIYFSGGQALVNGNYILNNSNFITLPIIYNNDGYLPQNLTWAICLNQQGNLDSILLTSSKEQFFATDGDEIYYLPSVTFNELIFQRKDLVLLALAEVTINSITINNIKDARKFIKNIGLNNVLVWSSNQLSGNFYSFDALKAWIINSQGINNTVKIKGTFVLDSYLDLTGFEYPVVFEGEGAFITITENRSILIGNNVTLSKINFTYHPSVNVNNSDKIGISSGGFINFTGSDNLSNILIDQCTFNYLKRLEGRPPFIAIKTSPGNFIDNFKITNCKFNDSDSYSQYQTAIIFVNTSNDFLTQPAMLKNIYITNNICNKYQGIYLTSDTILDDGYTTLAPGLSCINCKIENNICGTIGYLLSDYDASSYNYPTGLSICDNTCYYIATINNKGYSIPFYSIFDFDYGTNNVIINNNTCHWIHVLYQSKPSNNENSFLKIESNNLKANDTGYLELFQDDNATIISAAILVKGSHFISPTDHSNCLITNNQISSLTKNSIRYTYNNGIITEPSARIIGNKISGFIASVGLSPNDGSGIFAAPNENDSTDSSTSYIITNNNISRTSTDSIFAYVSSKSSIINSSYALCVDNYFSSSYVDSALTDNETIKNIPLLWIAERNKNQIETCYVLGSSGSLQIQNQALGFFDQENDGLKASINDFQNTSTISLVYGDPWPDVYFTWSVPLYNILPKNVTIISCKATARSSFVFNTFTSVFSLYSSDCGLTTGSSNIDFSSGYIANLPEISTILPTESIYQIKSTNMPAISLLMHMQSADPDAGTITIEPIQVTYRW